ncbi:hypothetical protein [Marinicrinis lubricantis]|uniref:Uncharacterized protein n=1 Tax=Marinicrinis lubricantis TaxID=2086470 RepID=A0ABW1ISN6_9BACL
MNRRESSNEEQGRALSYEDKFLIISDFVERWLVRFAIVLLLCMAVVQGLYQFDSIRHALVQVEQLEGSHSTPQ